MPNKRVSSSKEEFVGVRDAEIAAKIDELINSDFEENQRMWGWSYIDNADTMKIRRPEISEEREVAIVIQGGVDRIEIVEFQVERYALLYPRVSIIVSTWSDTDWERIHRLKRLSDRYAQVIILLNEKPDFHGYGGMNTNLQIVSTKNGIRKAVGLGAKYILKTRTDIVIGSCEFLQTLQLHLTVFSRGIPASQKGKIVALSMNSFQCRPFSVSDHLFFGFAEDLEMMWDLELPMNEQSVRNVNIARKLGSGVREMDKEELGHLAWSAKRTMMDESYLVDTVMRKANIVYSDDWIDSEKFLARCFLVLDTSSLDIFWPKYGGALSYSKFRHKGIANFCESKFGMTEVTFTKWLEWYMLHC